MHRQLSCHLATKMCLIHSWKHSDWMTLGFDLSKSPNTCALVISSLWKLQNASCSELCHAEHLCCTVLLVGLWNLPALGETTAIVLQTKIALKILKVLGCFHLWNSLYILGICLNCTVVEWGWGYHQRMESLRVAIAQDIICNTCSIWDTLEGSVIVFLESCHLPRLTQRQAQSIGTCDSWYYPPGPSCSKADWHLTQG